MAKYLLHVLGYPLVVNLKTIIKMYVIWDNPITKSDVNLMEFLFRPNIPMPTPASQQHGVYSIQIS